MNPFQDHVCFRYTMGIYKQPLLLPFNLIKAHVFIVIYSVVFRDFTKNLTWISYSDYVLGNILGYYTSSTDDAPLSDGNAR